MLGNDEIVAIAVTALLWIASIVAFVTRRRQATRWPVWIAALATFITIVLLHTGTGHRG